MTDTAGAHRHHVLTLRAALFGAIAVLLWVLLALFTTGTGGIPPFEVPARSFAIAFVLSMTLIALDLCAILRTCGRPARLESVQPRVDLEPDRQIQFTGSIRARTPSLSSERR